MKRISSRLVALRRALPLAWPPALLSAFLLTTSGCLQQNEVSAPAQLLPPEKMVSLLIELHTLEARTENTGLTPDSSRVLFRQEQKKVYWRHEVSDSAFTQSFRYYAVNGEELNNIYRIVVDSLAAREK